MSSMNSSKVIPFVLYVLSKDVLETPSLWLASLMDVAVTGSTSISSESLKISRTTILFYSEMYKISF